MAVVVPLPAEPGATAMDANECAAAAAPPSSDSPSEAPTVDYFDKLQATWRTQLESQLPTETFVDKDGTFVSCLNEFKDADKVKVDAQKVKEKLSKQKPVNADELAAAKQAVNDATACEDDVMATCQLIAADIVQNLNDFLSASFDDSLLVQYTLLNTFTSKGAAEWCQKGNEESERVLRLLLHSVDLQRRMLLAGGAAGDHYGRAIQIYEQIVAQQSREEPDAVLERLALACGLELCNPLGMFGNIKVLIDPLQRYIHYEEAYLAGELDEAFSQFTVQELRMVVNSDASDEQLVWGRESLKNYRPQYVLTDDVQFRYCNIVKSDVPYLKPVWYKEPRSYDQILSGGGKCGPRAWYGRFVCKAFGIPVWGVRQTGHACMGRWTREGWKTCFGKGFPHSYWGTRRGSDFYLETQARSAVESEEAYIQQVLRLEWMGQFCKESSKLVREHFMAHPKYPWWTLSMMQRKILAAAAEAVTDSPTRKGGKLTHPKSSQVTKVERLKEQPAVCEAIAKDGDKIIIPAACCTNPPPSVLIMDSFLGGKQVQLKNKAKVEYTLAADLLTSTVKQYSLTCLFCTVHRNEKPIRLFVSSNSDDSEVPFLSVELPYTMGMWQETAPVVVELGGPDVTNTLKFARQSNMGGVTVKEIKLIPVEA
jgi:hypothetical protein